MQALELIANAYYLSGIVSRELESVDASQLSDGLRMLNQIIAEKSAKGGQIPYYTVEYQLETVANQEKYYIAGLISVEELTYNIDTVRYSMVRQSRGEYFGRSRANNVSSLPTSYHFERSKGGGDIYLYYFPNDVYTVNITGKFSLPISDLNTDLSESLDDFYLSYLNYALAKRICDFYSFPWSPDKASTLIGLENDIFEVATPDMQIRKVSTYDSSDPGFVNYAWANLGEGFLP